MELRRYLHLIRNRLVLVIVAVILGAVIGFFTASRTPAYTATATIYVGSVNIANNPEQLALESDLNQLVATFSQMIPSPVIAQKAINQTHLNRFSGEVAASTLAVVVPGTNLIHVSVTDAQAEDAVLLTNAVSNAFVKKLTTYQASTLTTTQGVVPNEPAYVFQGATSAAKDSTGLARKVILGAVVGLVLSVLLILLLDYLDITIKSPEELERRVDLPVLGIVPYLTSFPAVPRPMSASGPTFGASSG
jgi:capsular polysaccharide biosynthesis protein